MEKQSKQKQNIFEKNFEIDKREIERKVGREREKMVKIN